MVDNHEIKLLLDSYKDFIHDIAFNFYGTRMATCSSDGYVRVYDLHDGDRWEQSGSFSSAQQPGPFIRVTWAHSEFGAILATICYDRFVNIWDEVPVGLNDQSAYATQWVNREQFFDCFLFPLPSDPRSINTEPNTNNSPHIPSAIQFSPKYLGLVLATGFFDGRIRIYEFQGSSAVNKEEIQTNMSNLTNISWSTAGQHLPPLIAAGSDDCSTGTGAKLQIWEYFIDRKASKVDLSSINSRLQNSVKDIQFAPNFGQSYHLLAVASDDIDLFTIKPIKVEGNGNGEGRALSYEIVRIVTLDEHGSTVWKVCWNVFGSVLYSCGDDGRIRLWKGSVNGQWRCESSLNVQAEALEKIKSDINQSPETVSSSKDK